MQLFLSPALQAPGARFLASDELRDRMEERFSWAVGRGHAVCVLACETLGLESIERRNPGLAPRVLGTLALGLGPAFQASEGVVHRDDGHLDVLLVGPDPTRMESACREWVALAKDMRLEGVDGPLRVSLMIGYSVTQPGKRLFLDTLIHVAREGLRVARCRGSGACAHTLVYDLLQDRLEQERDTAGIPVTANVPLPPGAEARPPAADGQPPGVATPTLVLVPSHARHAHTPRDSRASAPLLPGPVPVRETALTDRERREMELVEALEAQRRESDALRARLLALEARDRSSDEWSRGAQESSPRSASSAQDRIDLLERRLAKLRLALVEAEEHLAMAARASAVDPGIASTYRSVQGLDPDDVHGTLKAALMEKIFAANLELYERHQRRRAA